MPDTVCIYCRTTSDRPFAKPEHVVPQAFGTFEQNFTLHRVCPDCNQRMGDDLEVFFGRDSGEGFQRLVFGVKPEEEAHQIQGKRLEFRVLEPGMHQGAYVRLTYNDQQGVTVSIVPQVAFLHPAGDEWVSFREFELNEESVAPYRRLTKSRVFGSPEDIARLQARIEELGVKTGDSLWIENPDWPGSTANVEIRYTIDEIVLRTIAKIAFNYLAFVTNDIPDFVLKPAFDPIRQYIRYGTKPQWTAVKTIDRRILEGDLEDFRITRGHIVTVDWRPEGYVVAHVSLFNSITYRVFLAKEAPSTIWWDLLKGHVFDTEDRVIHEASGARLMLIERP